MHARAAQLNQHARSLLLVALFAAAPFAVSAQPVLEAFEQDDVVACRDGGAWVHDAAVFTYFKDSYYDLDVRFRAFSGTAAKRAKSAAAMNGCTCL